MCYNEWYAVIAQLVERIHGKDEVTSSNLVDGSIFVLHYCIIDKILNLWYNKKIFALLYYKGET